MLISWDGMGEAQRSVVYILWAESAGVLVLICQVLQDENEDDGP